MSELSEGSCVPSMCNNFAFVGEIVETPPALTEPRLTQIVPYFIFTSRIFQSFLPSYTIGVSQVTGLGLSISQAIGQSVGNTVAPSITLNPANSGFGVYAIVADGISQPLNGSNVSPTVSRNSLARSESASM